MDAPEERAGTSGGLRWAIVLAALVALVVAFIVLQGGGSSDDGGSQQASQPATQQQQTTTTAEQGTSQATTQEQPTPSAPQVVTIRVKAGAPVGGVQKLEFHKGDRIRFRVVSDSADEAHFHGYDIEKELAPGKPVTFATEASIEGRFEVELHHGGAQIARVDVLP